MPMPSTPNDQDRRMLSAEMIQRIRIRFFKSSHRVDTLMAGQYKSVFRGSGIEFEEVREYSPGDDVKSIDWKVSARLGRPFVKRYREERERVLMLLVDMSASGRFGTTDSLKMEKAAEIASVLAFTAIRSNDKVGAILFTDRVEKYIPPKKGSGHVWRVIREIYGFAPEHAGTDLETALGYLGRVCRKKTVCCLVSDFLSPGGQGPGLFDPRSGLSRQLRIVARKHDSIGIVLCDPGEFDLPRAGLLTVRDLETGRVRLFDASDSGTRSAFRRQAREVFDKTVAALKAAGIDTTRMSTHDDAADVLNRFFRARGMRRR